MGQGEYLPGYCYRLYMLNTNTDKSKHMTHHIGISGGTHILSSWQGKVPFTVKLVSGIISC